MTDHPPPPPPPPDSWPQSDSGPPADPPHYRPAAPPEYQPVPTTGS